MEKTITRQFTEFFQKYFLEGQNKNTSDFENNAIKINVKSIESDNDKKDEIESYPKKEPFYVRLLHNRRFTGIMIPFLFFQVCWWCLAIKHDYFSYFPEKYVLTLTMIAAALIAGMSSEGGGSVAFPIMTLALSVKPIVARDFSLMIQSCGMSAAAFTICWMRIKLERHSLIFCSIGAVFGTIFGLEVLDEILHPVIKKLGFVSIWFSFAFALFLLNLNRERPTFDNIQNFGCWKMGVLLMTGFAGGIFTSVSGSGVDICSFSIICILFRVSEKVATPTSIVLMAINTCVGFFWREWMMSGVSQDAWEYTAVCVPVVVFFAPLGSMLASHFHRLVLACFVYITDTVALVSALILIPMYPNQEPTRIIVVMCLVIGGFSFFGLLSWIGGRLCKSSAIISDTHIVNDAAL